MCHIRKGLDNPIERHPSRRFVHKYIKRGATGGVCGPAGILMGAVLLGVLINKASIPSARVVFSDVCLLTSRNGEPMLILRIGNTRGNFLLNPEIRVGYLKVPPLPLFPALALLHQYPLPRRHDVFGVLTARP